MQLALANALRDLLGEISDDNATHNIQDGENKASIVKISPIYTGLGTATFYVDLNDGKTYTVTVE